MVTRADPFPGMKPLQLLMAVFFEKRRPQIPSGSSPAADVVALMNDCWEQDPGERPDGFLPVVETLSSAVERMGDPQGGTEIEFTSRSRQNILDGAPVIRGAATTKVLFVCFGNTCRRCASHSRVCCSEFQCTWYLAVPFMGTEALYFH